MTKKTRILTIIFALLLLLQINPVWANSQRLAGEDRYYTNRVVVKNTYSQATTAIVVSGQNFPDAISAYNLGRYYRAPIILMDRTGNATYSLLRELGIKRVIILGGEAAVSRALEQELKRNYQVRRLAGKDRYETNRLSLEEVGAGTRVVSATGATYQESLMATSLAHQEGKYLKLDRSIPKNTIVNGAAKYVSTNLTDLNRATRTPGKEEYLLQIASFSDGISAVNLVAKRGGNIVLGNVVPPGWTGWIIGGENAIRSSQTASPTPRPAPAAPTTPVPSTQNAASIPTLGELNKTLQQEVLRRLIDEDYRTYRGIPFAGSDWYIEVGPIAIKTTVPPAQAEKLRRLNSDFRYMLPSGNGYFPSHNDSKYANGVYTAKYRFILSEQDLADLQKENQTRRAWVARNIAATDSNNEKIRKINNYLASFYDFQYGMPTYDNGNARFQIKTLLAGGKATCNPYSAYFAKVAKTAGLDVMYVMNQKRNHAWNYVRTNNGYRHIDSYWHDAGMQTYLLTGTEIMERYPASHTFDPSVLPQ